MVVIGNSSLLAGGDIITAIDGQPMADLDALTAYLDTNTAVGQTVEVGIVRDGRVMTLSVTLGELSS